MEGTHKEELIGSPNIDLGSAVRSKANKGVVCVACVWRVCGVWCLVRMWCVCVVCYIRSRGYSKQA